MRNAAASPTSLGMIAEQAFGESLRRSSVPALAWAAAADAAVVAWLRGGASDAAQACARRDGEQLIRFASLRESILGELDCPASPVFGSDLAEQLRALIAAADDLVGGKAS